MYRLILVDDEAIIRDGISTCIPWEDNGFHLAGIFEHGIEALEYLRNNPVDVVISDINMPRMDGLELSRHICREFPDTAILILTGYDDFEYAQEAVRYHVREFLLKPITAEEMGEVLRQVQKELDIKRQAAKEQELMKAKLEQSFPLLRERFLYRMLSGTIPAEIIEQKKEYYQWNNLDSFYQVSALGIPVIWNELDRFSLMETIRRNLEVYDEIITDKEENILILLQGKEAPSLGERTRAVMENAFLEVSRLKKEQISAGCGMIVDSLEALQSSMKGACNALDYSKVLGLSQIVSIEEIRNRKSVAPEEFNIRLSKLVEELRGSGRDQTMKALEDLFRFLEGHYLTMDEASYYFIRIHSALINFLQDMELSANENSSLPLRYKFFHTTQDARIFFLKMVQGIEDHISRKRHELMISRVEKARAVIEQSYMDPSFSLSNMCDSLYLSSSQFSVLFKEGTGQTFVEYLTAYRISEAKKLLKTTDHKSYEIAEQVGYNDPRYFSLLFKKHTNKTPMEYRKSLEE